MSDPPGPPETPTSALIAFIVEASCLALNRAAFVAHENNSGRGVEASGLDFALLRVRELATVVARLCCDANLDSRWPRSHSIPPEQARQRQQQQVL